MKSTERISDNSKNFNILNSRAVPTNSNFLWNMTQSKKPSFEVVERFKNNNTFESTLNSNILSQFNEKKSYRKGISKEKVKEKEKREEKDNNKNKEKDLFDPFSWDTPERESIDLGKSVIFQNNLEKNQLLLDNNEIKSEETDSYSEDSVRIKKIFDNYFVHNNCNNVLIKYRNGQLQKIENEKRYLLSKNVTKNPKTIKFSNIDNNQTKKVKAVFTFKRLVNKILQGVRTFKNKNVKKRKPIINQPKRRANSLPMNFIESMMNFEIKKLPNEIRNRKRLKSFNGDINLLDIKSSKITKKKKKISVVRTEDNPAKTLEKSIKLENKNVLDITGSSKIENKTLKKLATPSLETFANKNKDRNLEVELSKKNEAEQENNEIETLPNYVKFTKDNEKDFLN